MFACRRRATPAGPWLTGRPASRPPCLPTHPMPTLLRGLCRWFLDAGGSSGRLSDLSDPLARRGHQQLSDGAMVHGVPQPRARVPPAVPVRSGVPRGADEAPLARRFRSPIARRAGYRCRSSAGLSAAHASGPGRARSSGGAPAVAREQFRLRLHHQVQEPGLVAHFQRLGLVERRKAQDTHPRARR